MDIDILYKRIKERRELLGMTQDELAKKVGYKSRSSINKIEMGGNDLPQSKIKAIADALSTTPAHLMGWDNPSMMRDNIVRYQTLHELVGELTDRPALQRTLRLALEAEEEDLEICSAMLARLKEKQV